MKNLAIVVGTLAALLLAALSARYVTGFWLFFTFASFQIQGAMLAFTLSLLAFALLRHWLPLALMIVSVAIGVHGYVMLGEFRQARPLDPNGTPTLTLLSINIMGNNMANGARIADYIVGSGADVVFIQESAPIGPDIPRIRAIYPYRLGCGAKTITCDQSLWSKRPLVAGDVITASPIYRDRLMIASIDFDGIKINFANVHLTKPYFDNFHEIELAKISQALEKVEGPLVLAGDFNASILVPDVRRFLKKNQLMTAESEPNTWPIEGNALGMAIDHIFVRDPLRIKRLERTPDPLGSNHYGLMAEILWQDNTATYPPQ
jgi:endonuclease/exonuclease/phosphatase (EEP) superfamily protein YafD